MHRQTKRFRQCLAQLPKPIQEKAKEQFRLLIVEPTHASLYFKKVGRFWSLRVGFRYRALAVKEEEDWIWVWIGTHAEYDQMLHSRHGE
jgi:hypothetical protein